MKKKWSSPTVLAVIIASAVAGSVSLIVDAAGVWQTKINADASIKGTIAAAQINKEGMTEAASIGKRIDEAKESLNKLCVSLDTRLGNVQKVASSDIKIKMVMDLLKDRNFDACPSFSDLNSILEDIKRTVTNSANAAQQSPLPTGSVATDVRTVLPQITVDSNGPKMASAPDGWPDNPYTVGRTIAIYKGLPQRIWPHRFHTTRLFVRSGSLVLVVDGKPQLACGTGAYFNVFWKDVADYMIHALEKAAEIVVADIRPGKFLNSHNEICSEPT